MGDGYELRSAVPEDGEVLTSLYNAVFCGTGAGSPRDLGHWRWKYAYDGVGSHSTVAVHRNGGQAIVGHVGGIPLRTWCRGAVRTSTQSVDNMLHPRARAGLRRVGVFARMVNHWIDTYFAWDRDFLGWGFPSAENVRIGQRFSKYSLVRTVNALCHERAYELADEGGLSRATVARFGADADGLWERCRDDMELALVRDAGYLNWRYAEHPSDRYSLHEARDAGGDLRGLCVTRLGGLAQDALMIVDWLAPRDDGDAARALLASASAQARRAGLPGVGAWFPEGRPEFLDWQRRGFLVRPTEHVLVARSWDRSITIRDLRRALYATAGDMDFY